MKIVLASLVVALPGVTAFTPTPSFIRTASTLAVGKDPNVIFGRLQRMPWNDPFSFISFVIFIRWQTASSQTPSSSALASLLKERAMEICISVLLYWIDHHLIQLRTGGGGGHTPVPFINTCSHAMLSSIPFPFCRSPPSHAHVESHGNITHTHMYTHLRRQYVETRVGKDGFDGYR